MLVRDVSRDWCIRNGIGLQKATAESVNSVGGFLAPEDFDQAIIAVRDTVGAFRQGADVRPTRSVSNLRPRRFGGATAYFVPENTTITESSIEWDAVSTSAKKMAILVRASLEFFEDSAPDLGEFLTTEIGYAFAALEDDCGFNGNGTSTYSGISGLGQKLVGMKSAVAAASGHGTFLELDETDLGNLMAGVLATAIPGAAWYVSATAYAQTFCRLAATAGGLVARKRSDGTIDAVYLGFPVIFSAKLPNVQTSLTGSAMMFFGDLRQASTIVEREQHTVVAMSGHRLLDTDQIYVRGTQRLDIINHLGGAGDPGVIAMLVGG